MRDIVSPLMGLRSPFGGRVDPYKAAGFRPTLVADMTRDYYRSVSRQTFDDLFTHSRLGNATMTDSDGLLKWGPHNLLTYSEDLASGGTAHGTGVISGNNFTFTSSTDHVRLCQWMLVPAKGKYTGKVTISGGQVGDTFSIELVDEGDGSDSNTTLVTIDGTTTEWTVEADFSGSSTFSGYLGFYLNRDSAGRSVTAGSVITVDYMHVYRSDLGGMAPVPLDARVAGSTTYVPTTSTAKYLPRRHNHLYDSSVAKWNLHNLITYSEDFTDASWTKSTAVMTVTANAGVSPSGQSDATLFTPDTATNIRYAGVSGFPSSDYTFSIYAKSNGGSNDQISIWLAGLTQRAVFDLGAGTVNNINLTSASIEDVGNGWYRCVGYSSTATTAARVYLQDGNAFTGNDSDGIYIWGAHLYRSDLNGMEATGSPYPTYLATTGTAVEPTLSDVSWVDAGTLIETEARTNLITHSEDFTDASWTKVRASISASATTGPDGVSGSASKLLGSTDTNTHFAYAHVTSTGDRVVSIYAKAAELSWLILANTGFGTLTASFDLSSGSVGTITGFSSANMEDCGDGWYRCSALIPSATADGTFDMVVALGSGDNTYVFTGSASEGIYIYGAQFEEGSTPSSYCPSNGAASTRAADTSGLTIPSSVAPWPTPRVIGDESLTGSWATATTYDNTTSGTGTSVSATGNTTISRSYINITGLSAGDVFTVPASCLSVSSGGIQIYARDGLSPNSGTILGSYTGGLIAGQSAEFQFVALTSNVTILVQSTDTGADFSATISVKEIDPLVVAIQMQGRMTYADTDNSAELEFFRWSADANNELYARLQTNGSRTGRVLFGQLVAGVGDFSGSSDGAYSPGINQAFNIASYHGSTFINGAVGGAALTADTTPTALPDLSSTDLSVGYDFMGNIEQVRIWVGGITDVTSGNLLISEASS